MAEGPLVCVADFSQREFRCSVCLDLLKEPVTIPCGHSYCRGCIDTCWDQEEAAMRQSSCPQCRERFRTRPVLGKNYILAEIVEKLKEVGPTQTFPDQPCVDQSEVPCDFCSGIRFKASMSCLTCLASYCATHLEPHYNVPVLKTHQLVSVTIPLQKMMCNKHNKVLELYCQDDKCCICYMCSVELHQGHAVVPAATERAKKQKRLIEDKAKIQNQLKEREQELKELVQAVEDYKSCNQTAETSIEGLIDGMISSLQQNHSLLKQKMHAQEQTAISQAKELEHQLEEKITNLRTRCQDLEELSCTNDHIHFVQTFPSLFTQCQPANLPPGAVVRPPSSMEAVTRCVLDVKGNLESCLKTTWPKICSAVRAADVVLPPVPKSREDLMLYFQSLTLDSETVNNYLSISKGGLRVSCSDYEQYYSDNSRRFKKRRQVLCRERLAERSYWEVRWKGGFCSVAVAYEDVNKLLGSTFGKDKKSWSLDCSPTSCVFHHDSMAKLTLETSSSCIGVYLDYKAGTLSFYSVSGRMMALIHKERTVFTQPLHAGIGLGKSTLCSSVYAELVNGGNGFRPGD